MDEWVQQRLAHLEAGAPAKRKKRKPFVGLRGLELPQGPRLAVAPASGMEDKESHRAGAQ
jgi:hypothetical protein